VIILGAPPLTTGLPLPHHLILQPLLTPQVNGTASSWFEYRCATHRFVSRIMPLGPSTTPCPLAVKSPSAHDKKPTMDAQLANVEHRLDKIILLLHAILGNGSPTKAKHPPRCVKQKLVASATSSKNEDTHGSNNSLENLDSHY
jgi:hypothetical protein